MNGEGPSVPITTLAGIQSLTDLLLELPVPTPLPGATGTHRSLLSHPRDAEEAQRLLASPHDTFLVPQLLEALGHTTLDQVEVKDGYCGRNAHCGQTSPLLQYLVTHNPALFGGLLPLQNPQPSPGAPPSVATPVASTPVQPPTPGSSPWMQTQFSPNAIYSQPASSSSFSASHLSSCSPHSNSPQFPAQESPSYFDQCGGPQSVGMTAQPNASLNILSQAPAPQKNSFAYNKVSEIMVQPPPSVPVHVNTNSFSNNCSPQTPTSILEDKYTQAVCPSDQVLMSNGDCPDKTFKETRTDFVNKTTKNQTNYSNINNNFLSKDELSNAQCPDKCNELSQHFKPVERNSECPLEEPPHRKVVNSVVIPDLYQPNNTTTITADNFLEGKPCRRDRRKSSNEPIVVLEKMTLEDQALAQKSIRQFNRKIKSSDDEPTIKVAKKNCETKESPKKKSSPPSNKKETNYRVFTSKRKDKDESRAVKRNLENDLDHSSHNSSNKQRRRSKQQSYAESPISGEEGINEDSDCSVSMDVEDMEEKVSVVEKKSVKKVKKRRLEPEENSEEILDTNTYQNFSRVVESIFDPMEEVDFTVAVEENADISEDALIPLYRLKELCSQAARMKKLEVMDHFPTDKLVKLLTILERNVHDGAKLLPDQDEQQDEDEGKLWLELIMERVTRSVDSALTCLYIMTSPNMPEKVFLEDIIERVVMFVKFQLRNTVYPVFDPAYKVDTKGKRDGYSGSIKQKRAHAHKIRQKSIVQLYNKLHEVVGLISELLDNQNMTDTIILQMSTLGVGPFFVEGVSELQLMSLRLVTNIFANYPKHRQLILEDILASIARLPTTKRSLRNYRLNSEENIQMLAALVLQLIHSIVQVPEVKESKSFNLLDRKDIKGSSSTPEISTAERDLAIMASHDAATQTGYQFLNVFLKKCATKNEDMDYRPLFENFVQDLLSTVNKPEWPASEMLLSLLGRLLVQNFSTKSLEMPLRVASLDYLGVVAARLRKDTVMSQLKRDAINEVIQQIVEQNIDEDDCPLSSLSSKAKKSKNKVKFQKKDEIQVLQKALLNYLDDNLHSDPTLLFARRFYIVQWFKDAEMELRRANKLKSKEHEGGSSPASAPVPASRTKGKSSKHKRSSSSNQVSYEEEDHDPEKEDIKKEPETDTNTGLISVVEGRKEFLLSVCHPTSEKNSNMKQKENSLDYETAELVSRFLAAKRQFSNSFDAYLSKILVVLNESTVAVRTKAMKCLSLVVEADPGILARPDMKAGVYDRVLDQSTSVREAAVDLVGRFILIRPELTDQYYKMLTGRILDTGVSVRKRVIKIFKDICLEQPDFPQIPEICVLMIRRVNDEEGIKKLVGEVFQSMWFTPTADKHVERIQQKVKTITHVVTACKDIGIEWFEQLLTNLLKAKEDANIKPVIKSCKQIIDCLVENVMQLEESPQDSGESLSSSFITLFIFSKIQPQLVVPHAMTIQPYLSLKSQTAQDILIVKNVSLILQKVVPLMDHPSESFLARIEEDVVKLILTYPPMVLASCISCFAEIIKVTKNYQLVTDCFKKFYVTMLGIKRDFEVSPTHPTVLNHRGRLLRALLTVGLFCRYFDPESISVEEAGKSQDKSRFFDILIFFATVKDTPFQERAIGSLGLLLIKHYEYMMGPQVKDLYQSLLTDPEASPQMKVQVLQNLKLYLAEEEARLVQKDSEWNKISKQEDLKEMDASSGMASTVIQIYLKQVLESVLNPHLSVRKAALTVIQLTLGQGLVHPVQIVPYLICMGSDDDVILRTKADTLLQEIEKKYPGFVQMKALQGVQMSFKLQQILYAKTKEMVRGYRMADHAVSRNGFLYTVIRGTRQNRRAFVLSLLKRFDEQLRTSLEEMLYLADNLVYFPFQAQDEPLFIIHHIDVVLSVNGSNLLQTFREGLIPRKRKTDGIKEEPEATIPSIIPPPMEPVEDDDDDDDDFQAILERVPEDTTCLQECITASQGCVLLLFVKQTLKELFGFTDNKIQQYSPNEQAKVFEKPLNRKNGVCFKPTAVIEFLQRESESVDGKGREALVNHYLNFKQLMLTIDPADDDDDDDVDKRPPAVAPIGVAVTSDASRTKDSGCDAPKMESVVTPAASKPSRTPNSRSKSKHKTPKAKDKVKKKKKRRRILESDDSGEEDSDPDYE